MQTKNRICIDRIRISHLSIAIFMLICCCRIGNSQLVGSVDFTISTSTGTYVTVNYIGIAMDLPQLIPIMNSTLFQGYLLNSNLFGDWNNNFYQNWHVPVGYFNNCSAVQSVLTAANSTQNVTCTLQFQGNTTFMTQIGRYAYNVCNYYTPAFGWNMQHSDFNNSAYQASFLNFNQKFYSAVYQPYNIQLVEEGDQYPAMGYRSAYDYKAFASDAILANSIFNGPYLNGPGLTENADPSWLLNWQDYQNTAETGWYNVRCAVFKSKANLTIANILSESSSRGYLTQRFTVNGTTYSNFTTSYMGISDIRLYDDLTGATGNVGIDGITNSFAAALWAIDIAMEFAVMGGIEINFYNNFTETNYQNMLGPAPDFKPTALYYALLFTIFVGESSPNFVMSPVSAGSSSNIKIYGLQQTYNFEFLILNKDTNASLNGYVSVTVPSYTGTVECAYLSAPSLSQVYNISFAGLQFVANNSQYVGNYTTSHYNLNSDGTYHINIKYAQAALCWTIPPPSTFTFPRMPTNGNWQANAKTFGAIISLLLMITFLS